MKDIDIKSRSVLLRTKKRKFIEKIYINIAWIIPRPIVYWCAVRLGIHAAGNLYEKHPDDIGVMEALKEWHR